MGKGRITLPGKKGRPAKPVLDNTWKVANTEMPGAPSELNSEGLAEWKRLEPFLTALNRVSLIDEQALYAYCLEWGLFAGLMRDHFSDEDCRLLVDGPTHDVTHPLLSELIGYAKDILTISGHFGLNARERDLDGKDPRRIPSVLKRFYGNRSKVAESKIPESIIPMLPEWDETDLHPPLWMNLRATTEYEKIGQELRHLDLFTPIDKIHLCTIACLGDLQVRACGELRQDLIPVYIKRDGEEEVAYEKANPLHKAIRDLTKILSEYWQAYGMTPRARKIFDTDRATEKKARPVVFRGASFG